MPENDGQAMTNAYGDSGHERCAGRTRSGAPCKLPAGHGTSHPGIGRCDHHGGATPTHKEHAQRLLAERAEQAALAELGRLNIPAVGNPLEALAQLAGEVIAWKDRLAAKVDALVALTSDAGTLHAEVAAYERALDRTLAFCAAMARLNIDQRIVAVNTAISEDQGRKVAAVIERILIDLDVRDDPRVPVVVPRELRAIASDGPDT
jgi:hypothetical protein